MALRTLSVFTLLLAALLVAFGLFGLSRFVPYAGEFYDSRMAPFDNGVYPFAWGYTLLVVAVLTRVPHADRVAAAASAASVAVLLWMRATSPAPVSGQQQFPDDELLRELFVVSLVLFVVSLWVHWLSRRKGRG
jgi:hypothetical protein